MILNGRNLILGIIIKFFMRKWCVLRYNLIWRKVTFYLESTRNLKRGYLDLILSINIHLLIIETRFINNLIAIYFIIIIIALIVIFILIFFDLARNTIKRLWLNRYSLIHRHFLIRHFFQSFLLYHKKHMFPEFLPSFKNNESSLKFLWFVRAKSLKISAFPISINFGNHFLYFGLANAE
jgi:hypothetical protein